MTEKLDIYDGNIFDVIGLHGFENDSPFKVPFRWSDGYFEIKPKIKVNNILINFLCLNEDKRIIIFLESEVKNIKYIKNLKAGQEYILAVNTECFKKLCISVTPNIKTNNEDIRTLGLFIKNIHSNDLEISSIELLNKEHNNFDLYQLEDNLYYNDVIKPEDKSIFDQQINVRILPFKYSPRNFLFNSCIFKFKDRKYLFARKSAFVTNKITDNSLILFDYETLQQIDLNIIDEIPFEQYEDPRVLVYNNKIYVSCVNYTHDKFHLIHQKILIFDENFNHIGNIHPKYGFNGKSILENTGQEKNWTFFIKNDRLFCIYSINPHIVVEFDWNGNVLAETITHSNITDKWKYGICRGGSNPILKDNLMNCFFHSSLPWKYGKRKYYMGHYQFNPEPPFNILNISENAILWGNETDERILKENNPPVVFPCGAIIDDDHFEVSFGFNDEKTGIIKI